MKTVRVLVKRNTTLFFKDKAMFFTSLITPAILLVLYATFLGNVYRDAFVSVLPEGLEMAEKLVRCGIKAILNFAHVDLNVPEGVQVENVHLSDSLMKLSYNIHKYEENVGRANEKGIQ